MFGTKAFSILPDMKILSCFLARRELWARADAPAAWFLVNRTIAYFSIWILSMHATLSLAARRRQGLGMRSAIMESTALEAQPRTARPGCSSLGAEKYVRDTAILRAQETMTPSPR